MTSTPGMIYFFGGNLSTLSLLISFRKLYFIWNINVFTRAQESKNVLTYFRALKALWKDAILERNLCRFILSRTTENCIVLFRCDLLDLSIFLSFLNSTKKQLCSNAGTLLWIRHCNVIHWQVAESFSFTKDCTWLHPVLNPSFLGIPEK